MLYQFSESLDVLKASSDQSGKDDAAEEINTLDADIAVMSEWCNIPRNTPGDSGKDGETPELDEADASLHHVRSVDRHPGALYAR